MSIFSVEVEQELQAMISDIVKQDLPPVIADVVREYLQPQGYIKADRARKEIFDKIAPQTLEKLNFKGLPTYQITEPNLTYYKVSDIENFMNQYKRAN